MGTHQDSRSLPRPSTVFSIIAPLSAIAAVGLSGGVGEIAAASHLPENLSEPAGSITTETTVKAPKSAEIHQAESKVAAEKAAAAELAADQALRIQHDEALAKAESPLTQYVVQPGDNLTYLSQTLGWGDVDAIATWNRIADVNLINSGAVLYRPGFTSTIAAHVAAPLSSVSSQVLAPAKKVTVSEGITLGAGSTLKSATTSVVPVPEPATTAAPDKMTTPSTAITPVATPLPSTQSNAIATAVLAELANYRAHRGYEPMTVQGSLASAAQAWASSNAAAGKSTPNPAFSQQIDAGYSGAVEMRAVIPAGESSTESAQRIIDVWMTNMSTWRYVGTEAFESVGIGVASGSDGKLYIVGNFGNYTQSQTPASTDLGLTPNGFTPLPVRQDAPEVWVPRTVELSTTPPTTEPTTSPTTTAPTTTKPSETTSPTTTPPTITSPPTTTPPTTAPPVTTPPVTTPPTTTPPTTTPPTTTAPGVNINSPQSILEYINSRRPSNKQLTLATHSEWYGGHVSASSTKDIKTAGEWLDAEHAGIIEHPRWKKASIVVKNAGSIGGKPVWYVDVFFYIK